MTLQSDWVLTRGIQDSFYKELMQEQLDLAFRNEYDFDHPDAIDMAEFAAVGLGRNLTTRHTF